MSEENAANETSALTELTRLKSMLEDISTSLRNQRDILKVRNMNLPPLTFQSVSTVNSGLTRLEKLMVNEQTELGQLRSLADNAAQINSSFDLEQVLSDAMDVILALTGAERGFIILSDSADGELDFHTVRETGPHSNGGDQSQQVSHTVIREVLDTGQALLADNAYKDERLQGNVSIAALNLRSVLCVPLNYKSNILGVVYVDNRLRTGVFEQRELNLLAAFANQVSVAMENARLFTRLQQALAKITEIKELTDNVFESIGSGVITADTEDLILTFNQAATQILEQGDREQVLGQKLTQVLSGVTSDFADIIQAVRANSESKVVDAEFEVGQRGRIFLNMKFSPLRDAEQRIQGVALVLDDLTEQQERNEMLNIMKRYLPPEMVDNIHSIAGMDLGGERREVTCMFADVRPMSTFPVGMRPQQIMEMLNIYISRATECIHAAQGVIDKYMGTEIMVLFNTQLNPMENHAALAVDTALSMREAFIDLYGELGLDPNPHFYRIGIHTGVATLGNVGSVSRRDFTAIGDTINLSKRLEENTVDGQIIISQYTRDHLEAQSNEQSSAIRFEELQPIQVKGRQQKTRIYEVFRL